MQVADWLKQTSDQFKAVGIDSARLDAELLLADILKKDRVWLSAHPHFVLHSNFLEKVRKSVDRRKKREPIAYILGSKQFYGYEFKVNKDVLIPRPESEAMISWAIDNVPKGYSVIDVGTGSGALAISLGLNRGDLKITAIDISSSALKVAKQNARTLGAKKIAFKQSDIFDSIDESFDFVMANLPYLSKEDKHSKELEFEPIKSLYSAQNGLAHYAKLAKQLPPHLNKNARLLIEHTPSQLKELKTMFKSAGLTRFEKLSPWHTVFCV